jgi:hypothetical protein
MDGSPSNCAYSRAVRVTFLRRHETVEIGVTAFGSFTVEASAHGVQAHDRRATSG